MKFRLVYAYSKALRFVSKGLKEIRFRLSIDLNILDYLEEQTWKTKFLARRYFRIILIINKVQPAIDKHVRKVYFGYSYLK